MQFRLRVISFIIDMCRLVRIAFIDIEPDHFHIMAGLDGYCQHIFIIKYILSSGNIQISGRNNRRGNRGDASNLLSSSIIHHALPVCYRIMYIYLRRIGLLSTKDLHVNGNVIPVVAQQFIAMEWNFIEILPCSIAVCPRDDEFHVRLHRGAGLPGAGIGVEGFRSVVFGRENRKGLSSVRTLTLFSRTCVI